MFLCDAHKPVGPVCATLLNDRFPYCQRQQTFSVIVFCTYWPIMLIQINVSFIIKESPLCETVHYILAVLYFLKLLQSTICQYHCLSPSQPSQSFDQGWLFPGTHAMLNATCFFGFAEEEEVCCLYLLSLEGKDMCIWLLKTHLSVPRVNSSLSGISDAY